jgi:hypothetical protein
MSEKQPMTREQWETFVADAIAKPPHKRTAEEKEAIEQAMRESKESRNGQRR